ncbi:EF-hand calcium-binding domain-containing protein 4B [Rhinichthys klamathensis goyatoka]|uniref:EF-hand calcium-binding domain-containing protein 4B n=1 Tax=Rhinichthys klamathensis goyatoka TaxID=3034132 RepID=UPI0024B56690|nr:EF-hand calcium-binding domain-containing protein 4B [Rhinichthys klamathensis goyatoka]
MHGKNMGDQDDILGMAMDRGTKKAEDDLDDMPLASNMSQPKEMSPEAISTIDIESEMLVSATDLKGGENDYQNNSDPTRTTGHETPENTEDQLVSVDVTKHLQPKTVPVEKRRKMGSTRKNVREGRIRGKRDVYEDTETAETHLQMSQDSEMSLVGKSVEEQTIHNYSNQSEDSLLSEIERALNKTSQSSSNYELIVKEPNSDDLVNTSHLNKPENSEIKSLQPKPSQSSKTHSEPNSPERRRRKMGSTRKNPRQQIKAERKEEDKEDGEIEENLEANKQEMKNLEIVETSVVHNIPENKLNKGYLDVPSAHTSSSQLEESSNPIVQERTSPSTKRKFGSRRTNKGKQGLGRLDASDSKSELGDEVEDNLRNDDLTVCDPHLSLQPENQPIFQPISEQSKMEARNEEAAPKGTGAGLVSLDQIIKHDRSTGTRQTINLKNRNSELQFNVVMVGNSCVGKTSFIRRFHEGQFTEDYRSTIGVDTCMQTVELADRTVKLQIWDTAGQERFHSITTQVFHKADGLLFMYEITCSKSFISVRDWISQARERAPDDAIMILLGNKNDSVERKVQIQEGADLAREYNIHFMECSAATGANVSESMRTLAELLVQRKKRKEEHTTLRREPPSKKSGCC